MAILSVELKGGLGNQLFQIATCFAIASTLKCPFYIRKNSNWFAGQGSHPTKYYSSLYKKLSFIDSLDIEYTLHEREFTYYSIIDDIPNNTVSLDGFFQSEQYFKHYSSDIKKLFTPDEGIVQWLYANTSIYAQFPELKEPNDYCVICVRRGDYIMYKDVHNPCGMTYYCDAMAKMNKERYYIFSDDMEWCKQNFVGDQFVFLDIVDDLETFFVLTLFKNYIISNSTFYWWGSYLSIHENPRVIAPDKWAFGKDVKKEQYWSIYRDDMEVLERPIES